MIGPDYRNEIVLAAHEPVNTLRLGLVAKIKMSVLGAPFIRASATASLVALILILIGAYMFHRVNNRLIDSLEHVVDGRIEELHH